MKVLIFGLCTLILTYAAPSHLAQPNVNENVYQLSDAMLHSEKFWASSPPYLAAFASPQKDKNFTHYEGIQFSDSLKKEVKELYAKATVAGYVSGGKLVVGVNSTVASVGGHQSTLAVAVENATLLTGGCMSSVAIVAKSSKIYSMSVNNTVDLVAKNSQITDLIVNSTSKLFLTSSNLNLMVFNSYVHVFAFNSNIQISNTSSTLKVIALKNSTVTYLPASSDSPAVVETNNKYEYFQLPAFHRDSNSQQSKAVEETWQKLAKMAE